MKECYLVLARCSIDDLPVGMFPTKEQAVAIANGIKDVKSIYLIGIKRLLNLDTSELIGINVIKFNEAGTPVAVVHEIKLTD